MRREGRKEQRAGSKVQGTMIVDYVLGACALITLFSHI